MVSFMTSSPDRPQYYSHNVNVKCLISKTILHVKIFQWCYTLSNVLQIRKHIRVASLPAPFYRENSPNASKARGLKQCINMYTYINKIEVAVIWLCNLSPRENGQSKLFDIIHAITLSWTEKWGACVTHVLSLPWWLINWQGWRSRKRWRHNPDFIVR